MHLSLLLNIVPQDLGVKPLHYHICIQGNTHHANYLPCCIWAMTITMVLDLEGWFLVVDPIKSSDISLQLLTLHKLGM